MPADFTVVAIVAAFNEADIVEQVVRGLIQQGIAVYFIDDGSTDETAAIVERHLGRGVVAVDRLEPHDGFHWEHLLRLKSEIAARTAASWFIHHDADEFRESPWANVSLRDAIRRVDALGYNAVDFASFDFWPTDDNFRPGDDVRAALPFCSAGAPYDRVQIRCWKNTGQSVDLASSGGHEAKFDGRRVFPLRFILRHYPIRSQAHGERKLFRERKNRFAEAERARGWHVQYDHVKEGEPFLRDPAALTRYDPDVVRLGLTLRNRDVESLEEALAAVQADTARLEQELAARDRRVHELEAALAQANARAGSLDAHVKDLARAIERQAAETDQWRHARDDAARRLEQIQDSLSWRWTAPARLVYRLLTGR